MDDIIADAAALGKKIASHPKMKAFVASVDALKADGEAESLLKKYQEKSREIDTKASQGKPVEVDEKRELADLQKKVASNDKIKAMIRCETDYLDLMRRINDAIDRAAAEAHGAASGS
ncbi:MAG: YlbF family regulator [Phycisphaerales bacterium]|nr:YlbF family regulator [Phycisphaerales bacterium]